MKRLPAILVMLASAIAPPLGAQSDTPSNLPPLCLLEGVTAEQQTIAGPAALQRLTDAPEAEQPSVAALAAILAALPRCAQPGRWTESQREMAQEYVLIVLALDAMRRRYAARNVDLSFLDEDASSFDEQAARLRAQGVTGDRPDSAEDIVFIYRSLAVRRTLIAAIFEGSGRNPH